MEIDNKIEQGSSYQSQLELIENLKWVKSKIEEGNEEIVLNGMEIPSSLDKALLCLSFLIEDLNYPS